MFPSPGGERGVSLQERRIWEAEQWWTRWGPWENALPASVLSMSLIPLLTTGASSRDRCPQPCPRHPDGVCCTDGCCEAAPELS